MLCKEPPKWVKGSNPSCHKYLHKPDWKTSYFTGVEQSEDIENSIGIQKNIQKYSK